MQIFLVSGKAGSGKDEFCYTAIDYLEKKKLGYRCFKFAFADAVKDIAYKSFGWNGEKDVKGRSLLQLIGDGARAYNPNIWIEKMIARIEDEFREELKRETAHDNIILFISDCRYPNEIDMVKEKMELKYKTVSKSVRIVRPLDFDNGLTWEQKRNTSETALDEYTKYDMTLGNFGTLESYKESIRETVKAFIL